MTILGKEPVTLKPASPALIESYDSILEVAVQQNHKKLKGSGDGNLYPMAGNALGPKQAENENCFRQPIS